MSKRAVYRSFVFLAASLNLLALPIVAQETYDSDGGYIDAAKLRDQVRIRFDAGYDNPSPDRAEFFYPQLGQGGPVLAETGVDYQELEAYLEKMVTGRLSAFAEIPFRFINPEVNPNHAGLSDVRAGIKFALIDECHRSITFQLRGYFPSGDGLAGLGTEHGTIEPGLLFQSQNETSRLFGEVKAWVPIDPSVGTNTNPNEFDGEDFSGTVLRFGLGFSHDLYQQYCIPCEGQSSTIQQRVSLVTEVVGWSILDGLKTNVNVTDSADGDTIVNLKLGLRWTRPTDTFYVGYGNGLTGSVWYESILRAEYGVRF